MKKVNDLGATVKTFKIACIGIAFNLESYLHLPKLDNLLYGNDDIIFHRDLSPSPNIGAKLILDSILLRIMFTWIY
ncbi:MAG TPA: hypothetical protein VJP58_00510 [Candidatus Nitrosocosmicus sp.]|nr:hypothetical protein [Candidatus Nitrosocosmicus sp.]